MIDFDQIRAEIFKRHGVSLTPDDPILVSVTLNELVLQRYLDMAADHYSRANRELLVGIQQHVEQSKATAGRLITDSADYASKEIKQAVAAASLDAASLLRRQLADAQAITREAASSSRDAQTAKHGALIAAVLAGAAALVALAAVVIVLVK